MAFPLGGRSNASQEMQEQQPAQTQQLIKHILTPAQTRYLVRREDLERWLEARFGQRPDLNVHVCLDILCMISSLARVTLKSAN